MTRAFKGFGRRWVFWTFLVLGVLFVCEGLALVAFRLHFGEPFSSSRLAAQRAERIAAAVPVVQETEAPPPPDTYAVEVLHPYLGFVLDPANDPDSRRRQDWQPRISPQGFFQTPWLRAALARDPSPRGLVIGVFGGSVAGQLGFQWEMLVKELQQTAPFSERRILVYPFGMGGFKQPQQLMTLAYFLSLGQRFDVVINLDGFNDLALPYSENVPQGVHPFYPRGWPARVTQVSDPFVLETVGRISYLKTRQARLAAHFQTRPWSWSVTANLLWRLLDHSALSEAEAARRALLDHSPVERSFESHGPESTLTQGPELLAELAATWRRSSFAMYQLCLGHRISYYHFLQPNQYVPGSKRLTREEKRVAYEASHPYREPVEKGYPYLVAEGETLRQQGVQFHDLSRLFANESDTVYNDTCCHLNPRGNALLAAAVAAVIRQDFPARKVGRRRAQNQTQR